MPRSTEIQTILEDALVEVLDAALPRIRAEIVQRAARELEFLAPAPGSGPTDVLNAAVTSIQESTSQAEILRHLLESVARFAGRAALFVVKGGSVSGWQATGFENNDAVKGFSLNSSSGLAARAIQSRTPVGGATSEFDSGFASTMRAPAGGNCQVLPLVVKEKVAALIYADQGTTNAGTLDPAAVSLLTRVAGLWLELTALRKVAGSGAAEEAPATTTTSVVSSSGAAAAAAPAEEADVQKKAKRFARLLVDEIKLYNQGKVAEGRQNRDLYERLKEDIEKSRTTYEKRFGDAVPGSAQYFTQELIRILADNDVALMGASFPR